jgi:hypothetical protein
MAKTTGKPRKSSKGTPKQKRAAKSDVSVARGLFRKAETCRDKKAGAMLIVEAVRSEIRANPNMSAKAKKRLQREGLRAGKAARGFCEGMTKKVEKARESLKHLEMRALAGRRRRR